MSMEISSEPVLEETEKKDENEQDQNVSDGEIIDDDEEVVKQASPISFSLKKLQKNFRARHSINSDEESEEEGLIFEKSGTAEKDAKDSRKLNARIENGDEKYLQNVRKKIINELKDKESGHKSDKRSSIDRRSFHQDNSFQRRNRFERRPPPNFAKRINERKFQRNSFGERRENGKTDLFEVRTNGKFHLYFPKSSIKYTKTTPSISYAENPRSKLMENNKRESINKSNENRKESTSKKEEKEPHSKRKHEKSKRSRSKTRSSKSRDGRRDSLKPKDLPKLKSEEIKLEKSPEITVNSSKVDIKLEEQEVEEEIVKPAVLTTFVLESPSYSPIVRKDQTPSPKVEIAGTAWKFEVEANTPERISPVKVVEERKKMEPIKIERKKIRKIENKVNIFLDDSDEVDEYENSITSAVPVYEVKSKWSSPEPPSPKTNLTDDFEIDYPKPSSLIVPTKIITSLESKKIDIPTVVDSPEKSPIITTGSLTDSIFDTSSSLNSKSSTPQLKNVCSFLTDIESEGYLSNLSSSCAMYSDDDEDDVQEITLPSIKTSPPKSIFSINQEPDTTAEKVDIKIVPDKDNDDSDADSDDESSTESSSSSSSDSSTSSEESSDESSDDETSKIVNIFSGFGRFDAKSMPIMTQIKPIMPNLGSTESVASRFQPQQSIIRPPGLVTNLIKPNLFGTGVPTIPTPFGNSSTFGQQQLPIPFKIYSLKDAGNSGMIFPSTTMAVPTPPAAVVENKEKERDKEKEKEKEKEREKEKDSRDRERERDNKDREREKRPEKRERDRHRSRSQSRERERKKLKEDRNERRKTPPKRRSPTPLRRKHPEDKRDTKRREPSPKHNSHRGSHNSRHSPARRSRRSRTPPSRGRTPPAKIRRISPVSKHRRSSSPSHKHSPSPIYRRSPRRRYSPSIVNDQHPRRTPSRSPTDYDRRSYSPSFRKVESSPSTNYKPDSTISDTELERQQQFSQQMGDYYSSWNASMMPSHSPRRPNLDDRINRMLSNSPTPNSSYHDGSYSYPPQIHDNSQYLPQQMGHHHGFYYNESYPQNQSFIPPHPANMDARYQQPAYDETFNNFSSPRNFVNNSNLVEITQQKREKQRMGSNQVAVQVGNNLEIVPQSESSTNISNIIINNNNNSSSSNKSSPPQPVEPVAKPPTAEELRLQAEKKEQMRARRKAERERKRMAKYLRKEKLRQEIQKYFDAGISIEDSDDETLIKLRPVNINAVAERGIIKNANVDKSGTGTTEKDKVDKDVEMAVVEKEPEKVKEKDSKRKVLFKDGIAPGETSSDNELYNAENDEITKKHRIRRKRMRKKRLNDLMKEHNKSKPTNEIKITVQKQDQLDIAPPPSPPPGAPPPHLKQPRIKIDTPDMYANYTINKEPIHHYMNKVRFQSIINMQQFQFNAQHDNRFRYQRPNNEYNKHPNSHQINYSQHHQRYPGHALGHPKPINSMDPRINQQRTAEKIFA